MAAHPPDRRSQGPGDDQPAEAGQPPVPPDESLVELKRDAYAPVPADPRADAAQPDPTDEAAFDPTDPTRDGFKPPQLPTLVHCVHCHNEYESWQIEWRLETDSRGRPCGFWCCPIPGCNGRGFGFDIWPIDPDYVDEETGEKMCFFDDEDDEADEEALDDESGEDWGMTEFGEEDDEELGEEDIPH